MALLIGGVSDGRPGQGARKGRRRADRDAGPADGPVRARQDPAHRLQPAGHRRGRPDARHGLHPRHRGNLHQAAQAAPDAAVLGDDAAADQEAGRQVPDRTPRRSRSRARRPPTSISSSGSCRSPRAEEARYAAQAAARRRRRRPRSSSATARRRCANSTRPAAPRLHARARSMATWTSRSASPSSSGSRTATSTSSSPPTSPRAGST